MTIYLLVRHTQWVNQIEMLLIYDKSGLVSRVCETDKLLEESLKLAEKISKFSMPVIKLCKEAVNAGSGFHQCLFS